MSENNQELTTNVFVQMELRKYQNKVKTIAASMGRAVSMSELARIESQLGSAAHPVLRGIARSLPDKQMALAAARQKGLEIIEEHMQIFNLYRCTPDGQFMEHMAQFIKDVRDPCRGFFPELYSQAENKLQELKGWRYRRQKSAGGFCPRAEPGDDLVSAGYVFQGLPLSAIHGVMKNGLTSGDFTVLPIKREGENILAVRVEDLPTFEKIPLPDGTQKFRIDWTPVKKLDFDGTNQIVEATIEKVIDHEKIILSGPDGKALGLREELRARGRSAGNAADRYISMVNDPNANKQTTRQPKP